MGPEGASQCTPTQSAPTLSTPIRDVGRNIAGNKDLVAYLAACLDAGRNDRESREKRESCLGII